jgi:hypothetical protein
MIPDNVFIRCHSFWRNDLLKPHFKALPGVILLGAMRASKNDHFPSDLRPETPKLSPVERPLRARNLIFFHHATSRI